MLLSQVSTILGSAIPEEREANHWIEGVAIWVRGVTVEPATPCLPQAAELGQADDQPPEQEPRAVHRIRNPYAMWCSRLVP